MNDTIYQDLMSSFDEGIRPSIPARDKPMLREAWNNYTDSALTGLLYHYCPAVDDDIPEDAYEFVVEKCLGFSVSAANELSRNGFPGSVRLALHVTTWEAIQYLVGEGDSAMLQLATTHELGQLMELVEGAA